MFKYTNMCNMKDSLYFYVMTSIKKVKSTLTNDSKIKFVITKDESSLVGQKLTLKELINELLKNNDLYIDCSSYRRPLFDTNNEEIKDEVEHHVPSIHINFKKLEDDSCICYPTSISICKENFLYEFDENFTQELLSQRVLFDFKESRVSLIQYYLVNDNNLGKSYIFRLKFKYKRMNFRYGGKDFEYVVPCLLTDEMYKMELLSNGELNLIKSYDIDTNNIYCYLNKISEFEVLEDKVYMQNRCVLEMFPKIGELEPFKGIEIDEFELFNSGDITFFEKKEITDFNLDDLTVSYSYNLEDYFVELLDYYDISW